MRRTYIAVVLFLGLLNAAGFWWSMVQDATRPYELDYGEGIVIYQATMVTDLNAAYKPITEYPFVVFHYPPVYHLTVRAFAAFSTSLITTGRTISIISGFGIELIIGLLLFLSLPRRIAFS